MPKASAYFDVSNIHGKHDEKEIKRELDTLNGVMSVSLNSEGETIAVDYDTSGVEFERIRDKLEKLGYDIVNSRLENNIM